MNPASSSTIQTQISNHQTPSIERPTTPAVRTLSKTPKPLQRSNRAPGGWNNSRATTQTPQAQSPPRAGSIRALFTSERCSPGCGVCKGARTIRSLPRHGGGCTRRARHARGAAIGRWRRTGRARASGGGARPAPPTLPAAATHLCRGSLARGYIIGGKRAFRDW